MCCTVVQLPLGCQCDRLLYTASTDAGLLSASYMEAYTQQENKQEEIENTVE